MYGLRQRDRQTDRDRERQRDRDRERLATEALHFVEMARSYGGNQCISGKRGAALTPMFSKSAKNAEGRSQKCQPHEKKT